MEIFNLTGRTAIVTGGNRGIGFAIAKGLASAGARVIIANRNGDDGERAAGSLRDEGFDAGAIQTDVSSRTSVEKMVASVVRQFEKIDILVNNAGVVIRKLPEEFSEDDWDYIMNINLKGMFFCCQFAGKEMIKRKKGKIINISSNASEIALPGRCVYAVSKAGVAHLTRSLALEWARHGIHVNAIGPGPTLTGLNQKFFEENPQELKDRIASMPLARMGYPPDHIGAAVFLASDASDFITGQNMLVDGGSTIW